MISRFTIILLMLPSILYCQYRGGFIEHMFYHAPSGKLEALGHGNSSMSGDLSMMNINPASLIGLNGLSLEVQRSTPSSWFHNIPRHFLGVGYEFEKDFAVGVSSRIIDYGTKHFTDINGNNESSYRSLFSMNTIGVAYSPLDQFKTGVSFSYINITTGTDPLQSFNVNIGMIKSWDISEGHHLHHAIDLGASVFNVSNADLTFRETKNEHPVILNTGLNYRLKLSDRHFSNGFQPFECALSVGWIEYLDSKYFTTHQFGLEVKLMEFWALRGGYYNKQLVPQTVDHNDPRIESFTYGLGVILPFYKFTKAPLQFEFDYTKLPLALANGNSNDSDDFTSFSFRFKWMPSMKQQVSKTD